MTFGSVTFNSVTFVSATFGAMGVGSRFGKGGGFDGLFVSRTGGVSSLPCGADDASV